MTPPLFDRIILHPSSWPLFGFSNGAVAYCWFVEPIGFSVSMSPGCYHTLREAKAAYLRSKGMPALAYLDDSWAGCGGSMHGWRRERLLT